MALNNVHFSAPTETLCAEQCWVLTWSRFVETAEKGSRELPEETELIEGRRPRGNVP